MFKLEKYSKKQPVVSKKSLTITVHQRAAVKHSAANGRKSFSKDTLFEYS